MQKGSIDMQAGRPGRKFTTKIPSALLGAELVHTHSMKEDCELAFTTTVLERTVSALILLFCKA